MVDGIGEKSSLKIKGISQQFHISITQLQTKTTEFAISAENVVTHLTYTGKFTAKSLGALGIRMPFEAAYSIVTDALSDKNASEISLEGGYSGEQCEAKQKHQEDDIFEEDVPALEPDKEKYANLKERPTNLRDSLVLKVTYSVLHFFEIFYYELPVTNYEESGTIARLTSMLEDRHNEIQDLKSQIGQIEANAMKTVEAEKQKLEDKFNQLELQVKKSLDEMEVKKDTGAIKAGAWTSSSCNSNYRQWDVITLAPPADVMVMENSNDTVRVLVAGVYRISGAVTSHGAGTTHQTQIQVNGTLVFYAYETRSSATYFTSHTLNHIARLNVNDKIQIYQNCPYNQAGYNFLNIQLLQ